MGGHSTINTMFGSNEGDGFDPKKNEGEGGERRNLVKYLKIIYSIYSYKIF